MYKFVLLLCFISFSFVNVSAQLSEGDIMFAGFNADGRDGFSVVAMVDIPANTIVFFNDNEWNELPIGSGGAFKNATETELTWDTGAAIIPAGRVVDFTEIRNSANANYGAGAGSISGTLALAAGNEVIYAFIGAAGLPTTFITAIGNDTLADPDGSIVNTGLTEGVNAIAFENQDDVIVYTGPTVCDPAIIDCQADLADSSNWTGEGGPGNQSSDSVFPDSPDDVPDSFSISLPIELISFEIDPIDENKVELQWSTATEINNNYFTIERSIDGENWELIENIEGAGDSHEVLFYSTIDSDPLLGQSYYRLKQTDYDGAYSYSEIVAFKNELRVELLVYPNPVTNLLILQAENIDQATIYLYDRSGNKVRLNSSAQSSSKLKFDVSHLTNGLYVLIADFSEKRITKKFLKL